MPGGGIKKKKKRKNYPSRLASTHLRSIKGDDSDDVTVQFINNSSNSDSDEEYFNSNKYILSGKKEEQDTSCSNTEKMITGLLVLALLVVIALSILLVVQGFLYGGKQPCQSAECVELSGSIIKNMDLSADPCEDFYQYSCGRFEEDPLIPPDEPKYSWFSFMDRRSKALLKRMLDEKILNETSSAVAKARLFYQVCMNETATESLDLEPLFKIIEDFGSWTVTTGPNAGGTWDEATYNLEKSISQAHLYGMGGLFSFGVGMDDKNTSLNRLQFDQGGLSFSDYTNYVGNNSEKYHNAFVEYFTGLTSLLGANQNISAKQAEDIWMFEKGIAQIQDTPEQRIDVKAMYNLVTLSELQNIIGDEFNLAAYLNYMFGFNIEGSEKVLLYGKNYFSKVGDLIKKTSKETIANYLGFKVVQSTVSYLPQRYQAPRRKLKSVLIGTSAASPMWLTCASRTEGILPDVVGALYVNKYFTEEDKQKVETLLNIIVNQFQKHLPDAQWMDQTTRERAFEKIKALGHKIGYPEFIKDPKKLDEHYNKLVVSNTTGFENHIESLKYSVQDNLKDRSKPPDPTRWSMAPTEANAYYSPLWNQMVFPAGILDKPFFSADFPMAMNFGSMGFVMGHELTHGFDNTGRNFDKNGNMDNWWTNHSASTFEEKTKCLVDQYNQYKVGEGSINGRTTLGENIADNGGLKNSYRAYQSWLHSNSYKESSTRLPGLNMTENQLFFLAFAQTWCAFYTPEYAQRTLVTDPHTYAKYRVIGTLSNIPEFSDAFQCSTRSKMNPQTKCSVW